MSDMQWKMGVEHNMATESNRRISVAMILFGKETIANSQV